MQSRTFKILRLLVLTLAVIVVGLPLWASFVGGFKALGELRVDPLGLPQVWQWQNYAAILTDPRTITYLVNSLVIAGLTVMLTLIVASMAAFAFAQIRFFGSGMLLNYLLLGLLFPVATGILPLFLMIRDLGLLDSYWGVVLPQVAFGLAFAILLMRQAFRALPHELWESAQMDGCSYLRFYLQITLPLSLPILSTVGVITLIQSWNNYLLPLVVLNHEARHPWPLGIMQFRGEFGTEWNLILAFVTLTLVPAVLLYIFAQKYIIQGLTGAAVKG